MDNAELAHAIFNALDDGKFDHFKSFFHDDAVIWHNFDQAEQSISNTVNVLHEARSLVSKFSYQDRHYISLPDGAMVQHVLRVVRKDGTLGEVPAMLRIFVRDGRVSRVEEYLDKTNANELVSN